MADRHPLQRAQPLAQHDDAERDGDDGVEEVAQRRLGRASAQHRGDVDHPVHRDEQRGGGDAEPEARALPQLAGPAEVAAHEQHEGAEQQGPQDPVRQDLPRAGGLQRREVEREDAPDGIGQQPVCRAAPFLVLAAPQAVVTCMGGSRPSRHATVQVSRPWISSSRSASVGRPPAVSMAASDLGAHEVVVGRPGDAAEDAHRHVRHLGGVQPRQREGLGRVRRRRRRGPPRRGPRPAASGHELHRAARAAHQHLAVALGADRRRAGRRRGGRSGPPARSGP